MAHALALEKSELRLQSFDSVAVFEINAHRFHSAPLPKLWRE